MTIRDILTRTVPPLAWAEGENIPWNEPGFSKRMLAEHLSQEHDLASRRHHVVDEHVAWLANHAVVATPSRILDLACGPGLYLTRLATLGHGGVGIDFSPASVAHARRVAIGANLPIEYIEGDLRTTDFGSGFDLALLLYGQLNVFRRDEAVDITSRAYSALQPGGVLVVEPQSFEHVRKSGKAGRSWSSHHSGLFSPDPHLLLTESFWEDETRTAIQRFYVVDAQSGNVSMHSMSNEAYTDEELTTLFASAGFSDITHHPSLTGQQTDDGLCVMIGVKNA